MFLRTWLHLLGGDPLPGIVAVLLATSMFTLSELRAQRYADSSRVLDRRLDRIAIAIGLVAVMAMVLRFAAVATGSA